MLRPSLHGCLRIVIVLVLGVWAIGADAHAQFRSAEPSPHPDSAQSFALSSPSDDIRSLDAYARPLRPPTAFQPGTPSRRPPVLSREQKLLLGTVGMVVHSVCDSDWEDNTFTTPDPLLNAGERACVECDRMGGRAFDAVLEGMFSTDS